MVNSNGPRHDPWGTPHCKLNFYDKFWSKDTRCDLLRRWDVNHCNADPLTPKLVLRRFNNTSWSTVSNATLKSSNTRRVTRWESKFIRKSFCTFKSAVSVLWHLRYADWNGGYKPCDVKCACVWSKTARSVNFETYCKLDTGLKLVNSESTPDFLSRGETNASFQQSGNSPDVREQF